MRAEVLFVALGLLLAGGLCAQQPAQVVDLATLDPEEGRLLRVHGSSGAGDGRFGVPVAAGRDVDGDGHGDVAFSSLMADPEVLVMADLEVRIDAGEVYLIFGDGEIRGTLDTAVSNPRIVHVQGATAGELAGSEIWIDDVTGDGLGELIICRQNYTVPGGRTRAGAVTVLRGGPALRSQSVIDLASPPIGVDVLHLLGSTPFERFGIWARTGDVDGDGIADLLVGADQRELVADATTEHNGAAWLFRGGAPLDRAGVVTIDLEGFGPPEFPLDGDLVRIEPPASSNHYHLGATVQVADLDGNGRAELLLAAALSRAGAGIPNIPFEVHASGGAPNGKLFILWDDALTDPWPDVLSLATASTVTEITGAAENNTFGEEILGGLDYDGDSKADLFVGDLTGHPPAEFGNWGLGHVFFDAASLKGEPPFSLDMLMPDLELTTFYGPIAGAISADTALQGDFDGDGLGDLAFSSPHDDPLGRDSAGTLHVIFGKQGGWPAVVDLNPSRMPPPATLRIADIYGANGRSGGDAGDTLAYSGAAGDVDGNGCPDLIFNEMVGNGFGGTPVDVGNLLVLSGGVFGCLMRDGFESGSTSAWSSVVP